VLVKIENPSKIRGCWNWFL